VIVRVTPTRSVVPSPDELEVVVNVIVAVSLSVTSISCVPVAVTFAP
jgi:hypothetical protein